MTFCHVAPGMDDAATTWRFHDAVPGVADERGWRVHAHDGGRLLLIRPVDGEPAAAGSGQTPGFLAASPAVVDAWHERQRTSFHFDR